MRPLLPALAALLPLLLFACTSEVAPPRTAAASGEESAGAGDRAGAEPAPAADAPDAPLLTVSAPATERERFVVNGLLESPAAAVFRLRTELGCPRDTTLTATRSSATFALPLDVDQLTDVFACAIHVDASTEREVAPITVTPDAETTSADPELRLDPGLIALVAVDLDARAGHRVRFEVSADGPIAEAAVTLGGVTYGSTVAPDDDSDTPRTAIFEVPARAWAAAVIDGASATVDVRHLDGAHGALVLRPFARVEAETPELDDDHY